MENKYNLTHKSVIIDSQADYIFSLAFSKAAESHSENEAVSIAHEAVKRFYQNIGKPLLNVVEAESRQLPYLEEYNEMIEEIVNDIMILFDENHGISAHLSDVFNYAHSEKQQIENRIGNANNLLNDLNFISHDGEANVSHMRDSFNSFNFIQEDMIMGTPARISTRDGIVTLNVEDVKNQSEGAKIRRIDGNGEKGNRHLIRREKVETRSSDFEIIGNFVYDALPHDKEESILDGRPDTIFQYQKVNTTRDNAKDIAKGYDMEWAKGNKQDDSVRLRLTIELNDIQPVNWLTVNPYHPSGSNGKINVYSIRTSKNGFDYEGLFQSDDFVLNAQLNTTPQSYRKDELFPGSNDFSESKFSGQGVFSFPSRETKFIEIVLDQDESYSELLGHVYYEEIKAVNDPVTGNVYEVKSRVPSKDVAERIIKGNYGRHRIGTGHFIYKGIDFFPGWRYAIGLRNIDVMSYVFGEKSEVVSTAYASEDEIRKVILYANEKIPESFLDKLETSNDWIQYYVSHDDVNWHRISPMHHEPMSDGFPPKIIEFNNRNIDIEESFQLNKKYVETEQPVYQVRLKAILSRPEGEDFQMFSPVLEDYSLDMSFDGENIGRGSQS